jgi:uncharacterized paraquat-inducible protein A
MSAIHRVYAQPRTVAEETIICPRCEHRNPSGQGRCLACREELFRHARERLRAVGEFSKRVTRGEDMPEVTRYLRANGYPIGESPEKSWRRRRRQVAREIRRGKVGGHERGQGAKVVGR